MKLSTEEKNGGQVSPRALRSIDSATVRFAGDSGDGIQTTGDQFTKTCAFMGEDVATLPDFPSEIRAPAGTLYGVSGFQVCFGTTDIYGPGDDVDVLIVMNPAALRSNLPLLKDNGMLIINLDSLVPKELEKAGYTSSPFEEHDLERYNTIRVPISTLTKNALEGLPVGPKQIGQSRNFLALGITCRLFGRLLNPTLEWIEAKFQSKPDVAEANRRALLAGWHFGETSELFDTLYEIRRPAAPNKPGKYRFVTGNTAAALGLIAAGHQSGLPLFLGGYPITPATEIMQELARHRRHATVFQAEDEIAAVGAAIGASFGGSLAATATSGPGLSLMSEFINLAVMVELPLVVIDVQRAGPSTGMPTKSEQSDLMQALWGRHGESPVIVMAPRSPRDCFNVTFEACRVALKYMSPVIVLSDGYLGNGAEVWRVPETSELPTITPNEVTEQEEFQPYARNPVTLGRNWARPGTPGLEHRIGSLEKEDGSGKVNYEAENHEKMVRLRAEKINRVADDFEPFEFEEQAGNDLLVVSWGSTFGPLRQAVTRLTRQGLPISWVHLRHLNPLPRGFVEAAAPFTRVVVVEHNLGQLSVRLSAELHREMHRINKIQGVPFRAAELESLLTKSCEEILKS